MLHQSPAVSSYAPVQIYTICVVLTSAASSDFIDSIDKGNLPSYTIHFSSYKKLPPRHWLVNGILWQRNANSFPRHFFASCYASNSPKMTIHSPLHQVTPIGVSLSVRCPLKCGCGSVTIPLNFLRRKGGVHIAKCRSQVGSAACCSCWVSNV